MAIVRQAQTARLQLRVEVGVDELGRPILRSRSFNRLKSTATDDQVHTIAAALASLQEYPLNTVRRIDEAELVDNGL